jgi:hypothetical protein
MRDVTKAAASQTMASRWGRWGVPGLRERPSHHIVESGLTVISADSLAERWVAAAKSSRGAT